MPLIFLYRLRRLHLRLVRPKKNPVRKHFKFDTDTNQSVCKIDKHGLRLSGQHAANLERHIQRRHEAVHDALLVQKPSGSSTPELSTSSSHAASQPPRTPFKQPTSPSVVQWGSGVTLNLIGNIMDASVELVAPNGWPFRFMDDSGFRKIIDPVLKDLKDCVTVSAKSVQQKV